MREASPELSDAFLHYERSPYAQPLLFRGAHRSDSATGRASGYSGLVLAETLPRALRIAGDRVVQVEAGRYGRARNEGWRAVRGA